MQPTEDCEVIAEPKQDDDSSLVNTFDSAADSAAILDAAQKLSELSRELGERARDFLKQQAIEGRGTAGRDFIAEGNIDEVREILDQGMSPNTVGEFGWSPLGEAAEQSHILY